jgi:hypothetical protein
MSEQETPVPQQGPTCASCGAPSAIIKNIPLQMGDAQSNKHIVFHCGSIGLVFADTVKYIRTVDCVSRRIVTLEREIFNLKTDFWTPNASEPKLVDAIHASANAYASAQITVGVGNGNEPADGTTDSRTA